MAHVCPWWGGYFIDNRLRRLIHKPEKIVGPYVQPGMTVMDVGCGMGLFSIAMAKMVGDRGRVLAVDLQQEMLNVLRQRAERAGVANRIQLHKCDQNRMGIETQVDFALASMMVHEVPDQNRLLVEIHACLKPGGKLLMAEPKIHVPGPAFQQTVAIAQNVGFRVARSVRFAGAGRWCWQRPLHDGVRQPGSIRASIVSRQSCLPVRAEYSHFLSSKSKFPPLRNFNTVTPSGMSCKHSS